MHLKTLKRVLDRLEKAGLRLERDKCVLMAPSVVYLGDTIDQDSLHPTKEKFRAILDAVTKLKAYLGLLTYYGKFLPNLATTLAPLYHLLGASPYLPIQLHIRAGD